MAMPNREQVLADRAAAIERLRNMPAAMRDLPQWHFWRLEEVEGRNGLQKVPYYVNGAKRHGELGGEKDRRLLVSFDVVLERFAKALHYTGVGFAFLQGDGLVGIDLDWKETHDGQPMPHHLQIVDGCDSYTEVTPSGKGVHVIVRGQCESFKHDPVGVEVYCGGRYFTCTGQRLDDRPADVRQLPPMALAYMQMLVQQSKDAARAARRGAAAPLPAPPAAAARTDGPVVDEFRLVNDAALASLQAWVPALFGAKVRWYGDKARIRSKDLGRELEEDLQLSPEGVYDFGEEQGMSPIDVCLKWGPGLASPKDALEWLAARLGITLRRRRLKLVQPAPADRGDPGEPPPRDPDEPPPPPLEEGEAAAGGGGGSNKRRRRTTPEGGGDGVGHLLENFALVYGSDQVWDGTKRILMPVKNLRLLHGSDTVKFWLANSRRRVLDPEQIRFEPGVQLPEGCVNLFDRLPTEPVQCEPADVEPMLALLRHLTSLSAKTPEGVQAVYHQVLCWCARMVQRPGAKLRFALVFHGPQGTGKNLFWDGFRKILGKYGKMVGQKELEDRFNGYMSGKLLLIGNEVVTRQELFHNKNMLKWVITEDEIPIRGMHQETRWESNHANVVFLSNELMPVALEQDDRRHLVVYTPAAEDPDLYVRVAAFLQDNGHAKFLHYLLNYDIGDFNEFSKPLMTEAKQALIDLGLKPAERFANEWLDGEATLPPVHPCSNLQLYRVFMRWAQANGERFLPSQATFTRTVDRHVYERREIDPETGKRRPPALTYKQITTVDVAGKRRTVRCWVPRGATPMNGVTEGEWAHACIDAFERYVTTTRGEGDE